MNLWIMVVTIVVIITCGEVVKKAIDAFSPRGLPAPNAGAGPLGADARGRGTDPREIEALAEQVGQLAERLHRLQEEQRFLTELLEERPSPRIAAQGGAEGGAGPARRGG